ncbi:hypothetical protein Tco_0902984 [Tanacetum coccineum]
MKEKARTKKGKRGDCLYRIATTESCLRFMVLVLIQAEARVVSRLVSLRSVFCLTLRGESRRSVVGCVKPEGCLDTPRVACVSLDMIQRLLDGSVVDIQRRRQRGTRGVPSLVLLHSWPRKDPSLVAALTCFSLAMHGLGSYIPGGLCWFHDLV